MFLCARSARRPPGCTSRAWRITACARARSTARKSATTRNCMVTFTTSKGPNGGQAARSIIRLEEVDEFLQQAGTPSDRIRPRWAVYTRAVRPAASIPNLILEDRERHDLGLLTSSAPPRSPTETTAPRDDQERRSKIASAEPRTDRSIAVDLVGARPPDRGPADGAHRAPPTVDSRRSEYPRFVRGAVRRSAAAADRVRCRRQGVGEDGTGASQR